MVTEGLDEKIGVERFFISDGEMPKPQTVSLDKRMEIYLLSIYPLGTEISHVVNGVSRFPRKTECRAVEGGHWSCINSISYFVQIKEGYLGEIVKINRDRVLVNRTVCIDIFGVTNLESFRVRHSDKDGVC